MPAIAAKQPFETQAAPRLAPDRTRELWLGLPKGGKTLGGSDDDFIAESGFGIVDRLPRVDDYRLNEDTPEFAPETRVRVFELKPSDALENIADDFLDTAAIVGMDVLKEFNTSMRGQKGRMNAVPIANLDLAPCALAVAVRTKDPAMSIADLDGRTIVTKYPASVENWARKNKIKFARIIKRNGGIESYGLFTDTVIADMVESGASLVANDWRILGMEKSSWDIIARGNAKFSMLSMEEMGSIPGVIVPSRALLVRSTKRMSDDKGGMLETLKRSFMGAAQALGKNPVCLGKNVAQQKSYPTGRKMPRVAASTQAKSATALGILEMFRDAARS